MVWDTERCKSLSRGRSIAWGYSRSDGLIFPEKAASGQHLRRVPFQADDLGLCLLISYGSTWTEPFTVCPLYDAGKVTSVTLLTW